MGQLAPPPIIGLTNNHRPMNFRQTVKVTGVEKFPFRNFSSGFVKLLLYLFRSFFKFFVYFHVYVRIKLFVCATIMDMLHNHVFIMFTRKNYCCTPLSASFMTIVLSLMIFGNSDCFILQRLFLEHNSIPLRSKLLRISV